MDLVLWLLGVFGLLLAVPLLLLLGALLSAVRVDARVDPQGASGHARWGVLGFAVEPGERIAGYPYRYVHGFYGFRKAALAAYDGRLTDGWCHEDIDQLLALESGFPLYAISVRWVEPSVNTPEDLELVRKIVADKEA